MIRRRTLVSAPSPAKVDGTLLKGPAVEPLPCFRFADLPEMKLCYCCTVMSVPACVVKPLYIATVG
jgi:hypothetical protein